MLERTRSAAAAISSAIATCVERSGTCAVDGSTQVPQRGEARDADGDVGRSLAERAAERIRHDDGNGDAARSRIVERMRRALASESTGSRITVPGVGRVGVVDACRGAHEPLCGLGDHEPTPRADDPGGLREDDLELLEVGLGPGELACPFGGLDLVEADNPALGFRNGFLGNDDDVAVLRARRRRR